MNREKENHAVSVEFPSAMINIRSEKKSKHDDNSIHNESKTTRKHKLTPLSNDLFANSLKSTSSSLLLI